MTVVIDTNVLLPVLSPRSRTPEILRALLSGEMRWAVSHAILTEYREMLVERSGPERWRQFERLLDLLGARHQSVIVAEPSFQFRVITADPDDNKFSDCAITANADYVITEDRHFAPLADAGYRPRPITPTEFVRRHLAGV